MPLTQRQIDRSKPREKEYFLSDGRNLLVRVQPTGTKTFVSRFKINGKNQTRTVGRHPHTSLEEARAATAATKPDPFGITLGAAWIKYREILQREYKDPAQVWRRVEMDILTPTLAAKRVVVIKRVEIMERLQSIVARGSPVAANRTLADVKKFFNFIVEMGWREDNPLTIITRRSVGGREKSRDRALSLEEIYEDARIIRRSNLHFFTKRVLFLILATAQRPSEVLGISRREIQGDWWFIPAERSKSGRAHKVWLHPTVRRGLFKLFEKYGDRPFVSDHRAISQAVRDLDFDWTPHDLRRTAATRMGDLGVMPHVVEKILNHKMEGVMGIYNRTEYLEERQEAQEKWATTLLQVLCKKGRQPTSTQSD